MYIEAKAMHSLRSKRIVPLLHHVGDWNALDGEEFRIMVMDRLGDNLEQLFNKNNRAFPLETVLGIAEQFMNIMRIVH